jgi:hypothetical protein
MNGFQFQRHARRTGGLKEEAGRIDLSHLAARKKERNTF